MTTMPTPSSPLHVSGKAMTRSELVRHLQRNILVTYSGGDRHDPHKGRRLLHDKEELKNWTMEELRECHRQYHQE